MRTDSNREREQKLRVAITVLFVLIALIFTCGLFYISVNMNRFEDAILGPEQYQGDPVGIWEPAQNMAKHFDSDDISYRVIDGKLYMQIKSTKEGMSPEIDSLRKLDDGSYLVYVTLEKGSSETSVYELDLGDDTDKSPSIKQSLRGIVTEAEHYE